MDIVFKRAPNPTACVEESLISLFLHRLSCLFLSLRLSVNSEDVCITLGTAYLTSSTFTSKRPYSLALLGSPRRWSLWPRRPPTGPGFPPSPQPSYSPGIPPTGNLSHRPLLTSSCHCQISTSPRDTPSRKRYGRSGECAPILERIGSMRSSSWWRNSLDPRSTLQENQ